MSSSSVEQCALCADSTHDVHHAIVEVNVVIGVLVVHCELLVVRVVPVVVCDDAVVRRTLVLIAFIVAFVFVVAILHRILLYWRYSVYKYFWRDLTLKGPVKEWQRSRADVIRQETSSHQSTQTVRVKFLTQYQRMFVREARALAVGKNYHKNGHRHKANCRHECILSRRIRATGSTLERGCLLCVFTPTVSALDRSRLMVDCSVGQRSG